MSKHMPSTSTPDDQRFGWRRFGAGVLLTLGVVAATASVVSVWMRVHAFDTDAYVETVAPLAADDAVAQALATVVVEELYQDLNVGSRLDDLLPEPLQFLARPLGGAVEDFSTDAAVKLIQSDAGQTLWREINRLAHEEAVAVLTGRGSGVLDTDMGEVTINLGATAEALAVELGRAGLASLIPEGSEKTVAVFDETQLSWAQTSVDILDAATWVLPFLTVALLAGSLFVSPNRRRTLMWAGAGVALAMGISLVLLDLTRSSIAARITRAEFDDAFVELWDTLFQSLVQVHIGLLAAGTLVGLGAFLAGPSPTAVAVREALTDKVGGRGSGEDRLGGFVSDRIGALRIGGAVAIVVVLLAWPGLTGAVVAGGTLVFVVYAAVLEALRSPKPAAVDAPAGR